MISFFGPLHIFTWFPWHVYRISETVRRCRRSRTQFSCDRWRWPIDRVEQTFRILTGHRLDFHKQFTCQKNEKKTHGNWRPVVISAGIRSSSISAPGWYTTSVLNIIRNLDFVADILLLALLHIMPSYYDVLMCNRCRYIGVWNLHPTSALAYMRGCRSSLPFWFTSKECHRGSNCTKRHNAAPAVVAAYSECQRGWSWSIGPWWMMDSTISLSAKASPYSWLMVHRSCLRRSGQIFLFCSLITRAVWLDWLRT